MTSADPVLLAGPLVDDQSRCVHWSGPLDVVALRLACCTPFYGCRSCHDETADHGAVVWPAADRTVHAVACGVCRHTLSIADYLVADGCPSCGAPFNPGCRLHHHLYFG